jgi:hypothetical protein
LLDLAAVRFVVATPKTRRDPVFKRYRRAVALGRSELNDPALMVLEAPNALPRAFVTHRVLPAPPPAELLPRLARSDFDPRRASYVEGDIELESQLDAPPGGTPASITRDESHVVEVEVDLPAPGLLVLADAFYPAWSAWIDGEPTRIYPTNHLFRGVVVPEGRHIVRFEYVDLNFRWGAACSTLAILVILYLCLSSARKRA